jgi:hypothetical protein
MALSFSSALIDQLFNNSDVAALIESCDAALNNVHSNSSTDFSTNRNPYKLSNQSIDMLVLDESDYDEREQLLEAV